MTNKQLKKLAQELAKLEIIIQTSSDTFSVNQAKENMMKLSESADFTIDDMVSLDELISKIVKEKI